MRTPSPPPPPEPPEPPGTPATAPALQAQILATEHWSLLASRTTTQNEVLTRISMFLTLVSAGLVSLALVGQATGFGADFGMFAVIVLSFVALVGVLTLLRVLNVGMEDLMYVVAMNRLRAAYVALAPEVEAALMTSPHDDAAGVSRTYYFLGDRRDASHVLASSMIFMAVVVSAIVGLLAAVVGLAAGAPKAVDIAIGIGVGAVFLVGATVAGGRPYFRFWRTYRPQHPSDGTTARGGR
ncbi:hypothetical protein [Diaminobutyricimonas aerilata]|nr:hypothetical protein [Diaminobutyricimonas aerilata]